MRREAGALSLFLDDAPAGSGAITRGTDLPGATSQVGAPVASPGTALDGKTRHLFAVGESLSDDQVATLGLALGG